MSDLDELSDEEVWRLPMTAWTYDRKIHLLAEASTFLLPRVRRTRRRIERILRRLQKWQEARGEA